MKKKPIILALVVILLFMGGGYVFQEQQYHTLLQTPASLLPRQRVQFRVQQGQNAKEVAAALFHKHIIISDWVFVRYLREQKLDMAIQSGEYVLDRHDTIPIIVDVLTGKMAKEISVTIPEGYTIKQIDALLKKKGLVKGNEFLECIEQCKFDDEFLVRAQGLEGFLFPDTYFVDVEGFTPESFIRKLLDNFKKQTDPFRKDIPQGKLYDTIIMASLIERETKTDKERPVVAGILWKRLENHWYLGVDATLRYYTDDWVHSITYTDLQDKNPYNTYKNIGLPPTPIANPGLSSIKAAVYPTQTDYWYYLHDKQGNIHYAKTNAEHTQNKIKYLY